jgi:hypothetical protein
MCWNIPKIKKIVNVKLSSRVERETKEMTHNLTHAHVQWSHANGRCCPKPVAPSTRVLNSKPTSILQKIKNSI